MWRSGIVSRFSGGGAFVKILAHLRWRRPLPTRLGALLVRLKHVITKPAATEPIATALWLLLISAEIEELRRGGLDNAEHHRRGDG